MPINHQLPTTRRAEVKRRRINRSSLPPLLLAHFDRIADAPDAIPRLRRFILDLAVRGKLVEQNQKDESAAVLVAQVRAARSDEGLESDRSLFEIDPSELPYDLPSNWQLIRLGACLEMINGRAFKPTDWLTKGLPIVRIQNLNNEAAPFNYCDESDAEPRHIINSGAFLISWSGTPGTSFGAFIWQRGKAVLNQHIFKCLQIGTPYFDRFLKLAINGRLDEMIAKAHGGVGLQHITKGKLENLVLSLPPLAEQHRIVAKVDELMALCDCLETAQTERETRRTRLVAATHARLSDSGPAPTSAFSLQPSAFFVRHLAHVTARPAHIPQLRQTILNLAVRGKLVSQLPSETRSDAIPEIIPPSSPLDVPGAWRWTEFGEVGEISGGFAFKSGDYAPAGVFVLRVTNITPSGVINKDAAVFLPQQKVTKEVERFYLNEGDILLVMVGGSLGKIGLVTPDILPALLNQNLWRITPKTEEVDRQFLRLLIDFTVSFQRRVTHSTHGHLSREEFRKKPIALPPLAEQRRIVAKVDELMALCDRLEAQLTTTQTQSRNLLESTLHQALATT